MTSRAYRAEWAKRAPDRVRRARAAKTAARAAAHQKAVEITTKRGKQ